MIQQPGQCGDPNTQGQKATGTPIKIGAVFTDTPGVAWGAITRMAGAYFRCVNDNGGIGGHPIEYVMINDQGDANQARAAAVKLWESDKVLGLAGGASPVECTVNHQYYEEHGIYEIVAGGEPECFNTSNIAAVNQGPNYSVTSATAYAINEKGATKIVCAYVNQPGLQSQCDGAKFLAQQKGIPIQTVAIDVPVADYASLALKLVQDAGGPTGAILPAATSDVLVQLFPAAEQQGLIDKAIWYEGATGSQADVMKALGDAWNGKYFAQSEFEAPEGTGADQVLYRAVTDKYDPKDPYSNFGDMGFLAGRFMTEALLKVQASGQELTQQTVNEAVHDLVGLKTDILCKAWYFGDFPTHLPNNASYYLTPQGGVAVPIPPGECVPNPLTDPIIANAYIDEYKLGLPQLPGAPTQAEAEQFLKDYKPPS